MAVTLLASVSIALPLLFYLNQHVEMLRFGYEIESLKERREVLVERQRHLLGERASRADLDRVEQGALDLGLVTPSPTAVYAARGGPRTVAVRLQDGSEELR